MGELKRAQFFMQKFFTTFTQNAIHLNSCRKCFKNLIMEKMADSDKTTKIHSEGFIKQFLAFELQHLIRNYIEFDHKNTLFNPTYVTQDDDFFLNLTRYGKYFFTVMFGTVYIMLKPVLDMSKRPSSAIFTLMAFIGVLYVLSLTLKAMLGIDDSTPII